MDNAKTADSVGLPNSGTLGADVAAVIDNMAAPRRHVTRLVKSRQVSIDSY